VLLLEDDEQVRMLLERMLRALGYNVTVAARPAEAIAAAGRAAIRPAGVGCGDARDDG